MSTIIDIRGLASPVHSQSPVNVLTGATAVLLGALIGLHPNVGIGFGMLLLALLGFFVPTSLWCVAALVSAVSTRWLVTLGLLPSPFVLLDLVLAWGALVVAVVRSKGWSLSVRRVFLGLLGVALSTTISGAFAGSELPRPLLQFALLGQPFALLAAVMLDPPTPRLRRAFVGVIAAIVAIQVPIALAQAGTLGLGDPVTGSLPHAHMLSAVLIVGVFWILGSNKSIARRLALASPLVLIPILADAKQVIFALPAALIAIWISKKRLANMNRATILFLSIASILLLIAAINYSFGQLNRTVSSNTSKAVSARLVWDEITADPVSLLVGKGPAETVSRSAYLTIGYIQEGSPAESLNLEPGEIALKAHSLTRPAFEQTHSSLDLGLSSAIGVLGDLGVLGLVAYAWLLSAVLRELRKNVETNGLALPALGGWAILLVLGLMYDWLEQPSYPVFLAAVSSLALTQATGHATPRERGPHLQDVHPTP